MQQRERNGMKGNENNSLYANRYKRSHRYTIPETVEIQSVLCPFENLRNQRSFPQIGENCLNFENEDKDSIEISSF